jgi:hypothetical protein
MNIVRKIMIGLGSIVVVALVLTLAAPKTVRAVVSTLVTVVNNVPVVNATSTSGTQGVITEETDGAARQPVQGNCQARALGAGSFNCQISFSPSFATAVPAGKRLVIEYVGATCSSPANVFGASITETIDSGSAFQLLVLVPQFFPSGAGYGIAQSLRLYDDPGTNVSVAFQTTDTTGSTSCLATVSGYLEPANIQ